MPDPIRLNLATLGRLTPPVNPGPGWVGPERPAESWADVKADPLSAMFDIGRGALTGDAPKGLNLQGLGALFGAAMPLAKGAKALMALSDDASIAVNGRKIRMVLPERARERGELLVNVDTKALDGAWKATGGGYHIGAGGATGQEHKYAGVGNFIKTAKSMEAPELVVLKNGQVGFQDGRNRAAYLRDSGVTSHPVAMSLESVANAKKFGLVK